MGAQSVRVPAPTLSKAESVPEEGMASKHSQLPPGLLGLERGKAAQFDQATVLCANF